MLVLNILAGFKSTLFLQVIIGTQLMSGDPCFKT